MTPTVEPSLASLSHYVESRPPETLSCISVDRQARVHSEGPGRETAREPLYTGLRALVQSRLVAYKNLQVRRWDNPFRFVSSYSWFLGSLVAISR